jgi:hypothetical protein
MTLHPPPPQPHADPPGYLTYPERARVRLAANRVNRLYPGPVGAVLSKELWSWEEMGWRFGSSSLIAALVDHILEDVEDAA